MPIPTEPVGSLPRPLTLQEAIAAYDRGDIKDARNPWTGEDLLQTFIDLNNRWCAVAGRPSADRRSWKQSPST